MNTTFEYFIQEGNVYKMKTRYGYSLFGMILLLFCAYICYDIGYPVIAVLLCMLSLAPVISMFSDYLIIDVNNKKYRQKWGC